MSDDIYIALFRGLNVAGRNRLPMAQLRAVMSDLGATDVRTYVQSGNMAFRMPSSNDKSLPKEIGDVVKDGFGFRPEVFVMSPGRLAEAMDGNPFPEAEEAPETLHLFFLDSTPRAPERARLDDLCASDERHALDGLHLYLHAPRGIARSRLASGAEKALGVAATSRNWRTVTSLDSMVRELAG